MKYELSDEEVKALKNIIANIQIRGADAPMVIRISQALSRPIKEDDKTKP